MKIKSAAFVRGIIGTEPILYDGKFQVAFMGRSNVGKSTLINSLTKKAGLARSSSSPGKTIRMDFFLINDSFYFVDFPGYGYAKRSSGEREKLAKMILWYIMYSEVKERVVLLIIDAKVGITAFDADMLKTLDEYHVNHIVVANKIDNLKMSEKDRQLKNIQQQYPTSEVIPNSSMKRKHEDKLMRRIEFYLPD